MKSDVFHQLAIFGIAAAVIILGMSAFGYYAGHDWESVLNGFVWGIILMALALPVLGIFILARYWGDFAGRWGAARRGDEHKKEEEEELPKFRFD